MFLKYNKIKFINENLIDEIEKPKLNNKFPFYSLKKNIVGESSKSKINKISNYLKKNKADFIFISAPENVAWILNIRGSDVPNTPMPNSRLIIGKTKKIYLISKIKKCKKILKNKIINLRQIIDINKFSKKILDLKGKTFIIDNKSCSIFLRTLLNQNSRLQKEKIQPIFLNQLKTKLKLIL